MKNKKACLPLGRKKIIVAMSGGVDSSVVAALLVKKGYDVTGMFAVNYEGQDKFGNSCWRDDYEDALRVSAKLGIKLLRLNFVKEYQEKVLEYTYGEYSKGRTPNPDVMCNKFIKFDVWLKKIKELGYDKIATGHYAKVVPALRRRGLRGGFKLLKAKDQNKDQTYFLHQLSKVQLKDVLFPLGDFTKNHVRKLAEKFDLITKDKEESMGICFVGEVPMKEFLKDKVKAKKGKIVLSSGEVVGKHDGLAYYTIGQKIKVDMSCHPELVSGSQKPFFVVNKNIDKNEVIVGYEDNPLLYKKEIELENFHWIAGEEPNFPLKCKFRLRHRQELQKGILCHSELVACHPEVSKDPLKNQSQNYILKSENPQRAVTPGQFAVIYKGKLCLGGGEIK